MSDIKKNLIGRGYCGITLSIKDEYPLVIYRIENGRPVLEEEDIILIRNSRDSSYASISINGGNYVFVRGAHIREYDNGSPLSKEDWEFLKILVDRKLERLEKIKKPLEKRIEWNFQLN